jgi:DNA-binding HxlR family transcriptional regulator
VSKQTRQKAHCPVDYAFQRVGGKYKGRILWALRNGPLRYGELKRMVEGVSTKMLSQALTELKDDGLINRKPFSEVPPRVEYWLTAAGQSLVPSIDLLRIWAEQEITKTN